MINKNLTLPLKRQHSFWLFICSLKINLQRPSEWNLIILIFWKPLLHSSDQMSNFINSHWKEHSSFPLLKQERPKAFLRVNLNAFSNKLVWRKVKAHSSSNIRNEMFSWYDLYLFSTDSVFLYHRNYMVCIAHSKPPKTVSLTHAAHVKITVGFSWLWTISTKQLQINTLGLGPYSRLLHLDEREYTHTDTHTHEWICSGVNKEEFNSDPKKPTCSCFRILLQFCCYCVFCLDKNHPYFLKRHLLDKESKQTQGFPHSSVGKESACNAADASLIPGWGRSTGGGIGNPL